MSPYDRHPDPCLALNFPQNTTVSVNLDNLSGIDKDLLNSYKDQLKKSNYKLYLDGTGDWAKCYDSIKQFTKQRDSFLTCKKDGTCPSAGIKVPDIQFDDSEFYAFSEFWYSMDDVLKMGGPYLFSKYKREASVCHCFVRISIITFVLYLEILRNPMVDIVAQIH